MSGKEKPGAFKLSPLTGGLACRPTDKKQTDEEKRGKQPTRADPAIPPRTSFGIELEFLVAVLPGNRDKDPDKRIANILPPLLQDNGDGLSQVTRSIQHCLAQNGVTSSTNFTQTDRWIVKTDASVGEEGAPDYSWHPVEVTSPASYAFEEAFDMIKLVVHLITTNYRCRVNDKCGFHVHIGNGPYGIEMRAARNFAALIWAAEPLLGVLHPPERSVGASYAESIRRCSTSWMNLGATAERAFSELHPHAQLSGDRSLADCAVLTEGQVIHVPDKDQGTPFQRPRMQQIFRLARKSRNLLRAGKQSGPPELYECQPTMVPKAPSATKLCSPRPPPISRLRPRRYTIGDPAPGRPKRSHWFGVKESLACDVGVQQVSRVIGPIKMSNFSWRYHSDDPHRLMTIEAREAAGTLDAEWIVTWVRVLTGLMEFARDTEPAKLMRVIALCDQEGYDAVDLLTDAGLLVEARACEKRLERGLEAFYECLNLKREPPTVVREWSAVREPGVPYGRDFV